MNFIAVGKAAAFFIKRHSPVILSAAAGIGLVVLYALTIKETEEVIQEINEAPEEEVHSFKMAKKIAKKMAPSFLVMLMVLFCIVQSTVISQHRIRDLTNYSAAIVTMFNSYRRKNIELNGKEADQAIMAEVIKEQVEEDPPDETDEIPCLIPGYPHYIFVQSIDNLWEACLKANKQFSEEGAKTVTLLQLMRWAEAKEYDEWGKLQSFDMKYIHYGWEASDSSETMDDISGTFPWISKTSEDSGFEYYVIDLPMPKPLEPEWSYDF